MAILQKGSYESLRSQFHALRAQLLARTGQDPIDEERHGVVGKNDPMEASSGEPVLEMSICKFLNMYMYLNICIFKVASLKE